MKQIREAKLTKTQMGIYVECVNNPESTLYNLPFLAKLGEDINVDTLKHAIEQTLMAHPCMNTILYVNDNGDVMQKIAETCCEVKKITLSDEEFEKVRECLVRPHELLNHKLARFEIYITPSGNYLFEDIHHIIIDGTSHHMFAVDLKKAYDGELLELETYTAIDVAMDEAKALDSEEYEVAKAF